jgi:acyl carrier protein
MNDELAIVRSFLGERLGIEPARVTPASTLAELGIDSLILLELFFEFEERLGLSLTKDIPTPKTIGELVELVEHLERFERVEGSRRTPAAG